MSKPTTRIISLNVVYRRPIGGIAYRSMTVSSRGFASVLNRTRDACSLSSAEVCSTAIMARAIAVAAPKAAISAMYDTEFRVVYLVVTVLQYASILTDLGTHINCRIHHVTLP